MALSTYSELQTSIANWLNRQDLTAQIPDFIRLAEAELSRDLRVRDMLGRSTATLDTQFTTLPPYFREMQSAIISGTTPYPLNIWTPSQAAEERRKHGGVVGRPRGIVIIGESFEAIPEPDDEYPIEMVFYKNIPALAADEEVDEADEVIAGPTNWLLTKHPDVYLFATLMQSAPYLKDDERIAVWAAGLERAKASIQMEDERAKTFGSHVSARISPIG